MSLYHGNQTKSIAISANKGELDSIRGPDQIVRKARTVDGLIGWELVSAAEYCKERYGFDRNQFFGASLPWRGEYEEHSYRVSSKRRSEALAG